MGRYCSYPLPKQDGGTSQIQVNPTQVLDHQSHPVLLTFFQKRIEDESRSCAVKTGAPLRSFSRFLSSHLESIPARGTDAEGKAKLEVG